MFRLNGLVKESWKELIMDETLSATLLVTGREVASFQAA
jgi:hypothetical protein